MHAGKLQHSRVAYIIVCSQSLHSLHYCPVPISGLEVRMWSCFATRIQNHEHNLRVAIKLVLFPLQIQAGKYLL